MTGTEMNPVRLESQSRFPNKPYLGSTRKWEVSLVGRRGLLQQTASRTPPLRGDVERVSVEARQLSGIVGQHGDE
jgi:hypothetical protein